MELPFEVNVSSKYGAPMGRRSDNPANFEGRRTCLQCVPLDDGGYDQGGAYWGGGMDVPPLWCAWSDAGSDDSDDEYIVCYFRAPNRKAAKAQLPGARFYR